MTTPVLFREMITRKVFVEGRRADGKWIVLMRGTQAGGRQIIPIQAITVQAVRLTVQESIATAKTRELSAFYVNRPVPKQAYRQGAGAAD